jgi:hypothetical protein
MAYITTEARQQLLDDLAAAIDRFGVALAALGEAYERLDEQTADRLEAELFQPVQVAYGRSRRTYTEFAARHDLPPRTFSPAALPGAAHDVRDVLDGALTALGEAEQGLVELQDSMMPVEVGDPELRAGLAEVRALVADLPNRARELLRVLGR